VVDTRAPEKSARHKRVQDVIRQGRRVFGWWSDDFVVRRRECMDCGEQFWTIEVPTAELKNAFDEIAENRVPLRPWRPFRKKRLIAEDPVVPD
jgi:hypothetical protein